MEQGRFSLTPRTQRRSQNFHSDAAKIDIIFETSKLLRQKFVFCYFFLIRIQYALFFAPPPRTSLLLVPQQRISIDGEIQVVRSSLMAVYTGLPYLLPGVENCFCTYFCMYIQVERGRDEGGGDCFCTYFCMYIQAEWHPSFRSRTVSAPIFVCTYRGEVGLLLREVTVSAPIFCMYIQGISHNSKIECFYASCLLAKKHYRKGDTDVVIR